MSITALVHGTADEPVLAKLTSLGADPLFAPAHGIGHEEHCALTYRRMRRMNERIPSATELLADPPCLFTVLEWCAAVDPSLFLAMTLHTCLSLGAVQEFGAGRTDLAGRLAELDAMRSFGSLLVTEAGRGNSHIGIRTEAVYDQETTEFVLHTPDRDANKFMPNVAAPGVAKLGVVYARLVVSDVDRGVFPFLVPIRDERGPRPGVRITALPATTFMPLDYATIAFEHVRVPLGGLLHDSARLTADGEFHDPLGGPEERLIRSLHIRHQAWVASAAALAAALRASAAMAIHFAGRRRTLARGAPEQTVLAYRSQQWPLFDALATAYAMTSLVNRLKRAWTGQDPAWGAGLNRTALNRTAGVVKALAGWHTERVAGECGQRCGAHGMFATNRFAGYQGLGHMLGPAAGDSYLIVLESAKAMAAGSAYDPPEPRLPQPARRDPADPQVVLELLGHRERELQSALADGMRTAVRRGQAPFEAWNNRSWLARELVEAHGSRLAVESLLADAPTDTHVADLAVFFGLRDLWRDCGSLVCAGVLGADQVRAIPTILNRLCERLAPHAMTLADALLPPGLDLRAVEYPDHVQVS